MTATLKIDADAPLAATWMPQVGYFERIISLMAEKLEMPLQQTLTRVIGQFPYLSLEALSTREFTQMTQAVRQVVQDLAAANEDIVPIHELLILLMLDPRWDGPPPAAVRRLILTDRLIWEKPDWVYDLVLLRMARSTHATSVDLAKALRQAREAGEWDWRRLPLDLREALRDPVELLCTSYGVGRAVGDSLLFRRLLYPSSRELYDLYITAFGEAEIPLDIPDVPDYGV